MRIGIDARMYSAKFTGIGRYNYELIHGLAKLHSKHTFVIFLNSPEYEQFALPASNFEKVLVNAKHYSIAEQILFLRLLKKSKLDLMHFSHFNNPLLYTGKQVVTIHDLTLSYFPGKKMTSIIHRMAYNLSIWAVTKKAKKIISISNNTSNDLKKLLKVPRSKITMIYEGAADSFAKPMPLKERQSILKHYHLKHPFLLYAGVWRSHKNVVGLIKGFKKLLSEYDEPIDLVITGRNDPVYHEVPDTVRALGLEDRVHFVGLVPEIHLVALYQSAEAYVFPSFYEGFGLPALEAFAVDLPVVSSNSSCLPEICGEGNALFFDPNNIDEMAKQMKRVLTDKDIRHQLIQGGKERLKDFSWDEMCKQTLALYESVL